MHPTRISRLAILAALVLALAFVGGAKTAAAPGDTFDKDAFLSRKKWYVTFTVRLKGIGEVNRPSKRNNDPSYRKETWDILREVSGVVGLDDVRPGQFPYSHLPTDPAAIQSMLSERGRFIGWANTSPDTPKFAALARGDPEMAGSPKYIPVSYTVNDLVRHESASMGEAGLVSKFWGTKKIKGAGTAYMRRFGAGSFLCDLKEMKFDLRLENARKAGRGFEAGAPDVNIEEETHASGAGDDDDQVLPPKTVKPGEFLPAMTETLREQLLWRNLEVHGDKIAFTVSETVKALPFGADRHITGGPPLELSMDVLISPSPPSRARLILKPHDYDEWRPLCSDSEDKPGNDMKIDWNVEEEGGDPAHPSKVSRVVFSLLNTSTEPGVCMNYPLRPKMPADFDLKFSAAQTPRPGYAVPADGQKLTLTDSLTGAGKGTVAVDCFDSGATGVLVAEATLEDGRVLKATLDKTGDAQLMIPDFEPGVSWISKNWREKKAPGKKDDADDENVPLGDGQVGDGLTLWEEYRGFWIGGSWDGYCDPSTKDLFISNQVGGPAARGIGKFGSITGLLVHQQLAKDEFKADRVVNFNKGARPHLVDQHCIVVTSGGSIDESDDGVITTGSIARPVDGAVGDGPPKNTMEVSFLPSMLRGTMPVIQNRKGESYGIASADRTVCHELGHALGISHHGNKDSGFRPWTYTREDTGQLITWADGAQVTVRNEETGDIMLPLELFPGMAPGEVKIVWIGERQGQMSGDEACVMRYVVARAYRSLAYPNVLYYTQGGEISGNRLCTSPAGTGVNMPTHEPQSRYGGADSDSGSGDCTHRLVVSDHWDKKRWGKKR